MGAAEAEDIASEAFTNVVSAIERGVGPDELFRPYLYTVVRNLAGAEFRRRAHLTDADVDLEAFEDDAPDVATAMATAVDSSTLGRAFRSLPERWQTVLWYTEVEGLRPRHVAPLVDLRPGAVSSLAFRARQALRAAWVQEHLALQGLSDECRRVLASFGAYEAGTLSARERRSLEAHVRQCVHCPPVVEDARRLAGRIAAAVLPPAAGLVVARSALHAGAPAAASERHVRGSRPASHVGRAFHGQAVALAVGALATVVVVTVAVAAIGQWSGARAPGQAASDTAPSHGAAGTPAEPGTPAPAVPGPRATPLPGPVPHGVDSAATGPGTAAPTPTTAPASTVVAPVVPVPVAEESTLPDPASDPGDSASAPPTGTESVPDDGEPSLPRSAPPVLADDSLLVAEQLVDLTGTATPGSRIDLTPDAASGTDTVSATVAPDGVWTARLRFPEDGVHRVLVTATTPGHTTSSSVTVVVTVDTTAPGAPTLATTWRDTDTAPPTFSGTAEPGSTVELRVVGQPGSTTTTADASGRWRATIDGLSPSATGIRVTARDAAGNTSPATTSSTFAFVPTVVVPADGSTVPLGPLPITITGWAGTSVPVEVDGVLAGTVTLGSDGRFAGHVRSGVDGGLPVGRHTITVRYQGADGGTSPNIAVTTITVGT